MKKAVLSFALASGLALLVPTTACNNRKNDSACGSEYSDYLGCFQDKQACTSSGTTDETITNGTCGVQYQAWIHCCTGIEGGVADGGFPQCGF